MPRKMKLCWILTLTIFLITATGCATSRWIPINEELERDGSGLHKESGQAISEFKLTDGTDSVYDGRVRLADQDSLIFWQREHVKGYSESGKWVPESWHTVPGPVYSLDAINALKVDESNLGNTVLLVLGVGAGIAVVVGLISVATSPIASN